MLLLQAPDDALSLVTDVACAVDAAASWVDNIGGTSFPPGCELAKVTTATTTELVAPPASGVRNLQTLLVRNVHATDSVRVGVIVARGVTETEPAAFTLLAGEWFQFIDGDGWSHFSANGARKQYTSAQATSAQIDAERTSRVNADNALSAAIAVVSGDLTSVKNVVSGLAAGAGSVTSAEYLSLVNRVSANSATGGGGSVASSEHLSVVDRVSAEEAARASADNVLSAAIAAVSAQHTSLAGSVAGALSAIVANSAQMTSADNAISAVAADALSAARGASAAAANVSAAHASLAGSVAGALSAIAANSAQMTSADNAISAAAANALSVGNAASAAAANALSVGNAASAAAANALSAIAANSAQMTSADNAISAQLASVNSVLRVVSAQMTSADNAISAQVASVNSVLRVVSAQMTSADNAISAAAANALSVGNAASAAAANALSVGNAASAAAAAISADLTSVKSVVGANSAQMTSADAALSARINSIVAGAASVTSAEYLSLVNRVSANSAAGPGGGSVTSAEVASWLNSVSAAAASAISIVSARVESAMGIQRVLAGDQLVTASALVSVSGMAFTVANGGTYGFAFNIGISSPITLAAPQFALSGPTANYVYGDAVYRGGVGDFRTALASFNNRWTGLTTVSATGVRRAMRLDGTFKASADGVVVLNIGNQISGNGAGSAITVLAGSYGLVWRIS